MKASFSHLPLSLFEGCLARKLRFHILPLSDFEGRLARKLCFHIFNFYFLRHISHESFVSHLHLYFLRDVSHESFVFTSCAFTFWGHLARNSFKLGCTKCCVLQDKTWDKWMGKLFRRAVAEQVRLYWDHGRIGRAVELTVPALFCRRSCA